MVTESKITTYGQFGGVEHWYTVTVEQVVSGCARLVVECGVAETDESVNSQGVDLSPSELRALSYQLLAAADMAEQDED